MSIALRTATLRSNKPIRGNIVLFEDYKNLEHSIDELRDAMPNLSTAYFETLEVICNYSYAIEFLTSDLIAQKLNKTARTINRQLASLAELNIIEIMNDKLTVVVEVPNQESIDTFQIKATSKIYRLRKPNELNNVQRADLAINTTTSPLTKKERTLRSTTGRIKNKALEKENSVHRLTESEATTHPILRQKGHTGIERLAVYVENKNAIPNTRSINLGETNHRPMWIEAECQNGIFCHLDLPIYKALTHLTIKYHKNRLLNNPNWVPINYTPISVVDILKLKGVKRGSGSYASVITSILRIANTQYNILTSSQIPGFEGNLYGVGEVQKIVAFITNLSSTPPKVVIDKNGDEQLQYDKVTNQSRLLAIKWPEPLFEQLMTDNHVAYPPLIINEDPFTIKLVDYLRYLTARSRTKTNRSGQISYGNLTQEFFATQLQASCSRYKKKLFTLLKTCLSKRAPTTDQYNDLNGDWVCGELYGMSIAINYKEDTVEYKQNESFQEAINPHHHEGYNLMAGSPIVENMFYTGVLKPLHKLTPIHLINQLFVASLSLLHSDFSLFKVRF
ncbi:hypothetical protein [Vibrio rarus]|uniref:hypothetical protein n=1 Tax=Vibrio rarus TaxID=413403 RepID=UPI0021C33180|nr:hypothetical protein [Vibrio rarus]